MAVADIVGASEGGGGRQTVCVLHGERADGGGRAREGVRARMSAECWRARVGEQYGHAAHRSVRVRCLWAGAGGRDSITGKSCGLFEQTRFPNGYDESGVDYKAAAALLCNSVGKKFS